jgi:hypothetical protein
MRTRRRDDETERLQQADTGGTGQGLIRLSPLPTTIPLGAKKVTDRPSAKCFAPSTINQEAIDCKGAPCDERVGPPYSQLQWTVRCAARR